MIPSSDRQLENLLSTPTPATIDAVRNLDGDLLILGAGGKMGPSLARLAKRSIQTAGLPHRVICVSRWSEPKIRNGLQEADIETLSCDLLDAGALERLPAAPNIVFLAGFKFGASKAPDYAWAMNCYLPALAAERYESSRFVALSTGNVYPLVGDDVAGATEDTPVDPIGEYAQSALGRERLLQYMSARNDTPVTILRLNYATDLRYGVLVDLCYNVLTGAPVDLAVPFFNTIWQGDANSIVLRSFSLCSTPPDILNVTGPEVLSVRDVAERFGELLNRKPSFKEAEDGSSLLSDASRCHRLFGVPSVSADTLIEWVAGWMEGGGRLLGKPTHFDRQSGSF